MLVGKDEDCNYFDLVIFDCVYVSYGGKIGKQDGEAVYMGTQLGASFEESLETLKAFK